MLDFLELLAADVADSSAPGIAAANHVRTVLFECLFNHLANKRVKSLFIILGFGHDFDCYIIVGYPARSAARTAKEIEKTVTDFGGMYLVIKRPIGNSTTVVTLIRPIGTATPGIICNTIAPSFAADRPITLGSQHIGTDSAMHSIQATFHCLWAVSTLAVTVQPLPRPLRTDDALPERTLVGDADARGELIRVVYRGLTAADPDNPMLLTVSAFLKFGGSLETTARKLNVHPNTVRYRLKRVAESTGRDATDPYEAYVLITVIALGHVAEA